MPMNNTFQTPPEARPVILLVGAALGIGRAIAHLATARGFALAACDIDLGALESLKPELAPDALVGRADIVDAGSVQAFVRAALERFGRIDAVISNAGGMISLVHEGAVEANIRAFKDIPAGDWKPIIDLNLYGPLNVAHAVLPSMLERGRGRIVFISSVSGLSGGAGLSVYAAAKGAVHAFAKSLAREVTAAGVSVNCIAPGAVATRAFPEGSPSIERRLRSVSIGRLGLPEEIAQVALYVAADAPPYLSGEIIAVSGGPP
jgi:NAD(P)-dependent dehydrogenase (short-subunit alcohol dehydrogenase family)